MKSMIHTYSLQCDVTSLHLSFSTCMWDMKWINHKTQNCLFVLSFSCTSNVCEGEQDGRDRGLCFWRFDQWPGIFQCVQSYHIREGVQLCPRITFPVFFFLLYHPDKFDVKQLKRRTDSSVSTSPGGKSASWCFCFCFFLCLYICLPFSPHGSPNNIININNAACDISVF